MKGKRVSFLVGLIIFPFVLPHPQCLDYRPPFSVEGGLRYCKEYRDFGCCDRDADRQIRDQVASLIIVLRNEGIRKCRRHLRTLLCQRCSPYAAHLFESESTGRERPIPGLCEGYCDIFYEKCYTVIRHLTSNDVILQSLSSQESFCQQVSLKDKRYCYNDILQNTDLNREIVREQVTTEGCLCLEPFDSGLDNPLNLLSPPDGTGRIFITEQKGLVHVYHRDGGRMHQPFLDVQDTAFHFAGRFGVCGLLGMAFHPNFAKNRRFFIQYTSYVNDTLFNTVSQFTVDEDNKDTADRSSEKVILKIYQPLVNHNLGTMFFGADGYLYLFSGDGGGAGDANNYTQNPGVLLGKVLRIDVDGLDHVRNLPYRIPGDNPFINAPGFRPEIYALGLRSPWRCDVDEGDPVTGANRGRIMCGDVGQAAWEEVNVIKPGANYGWNIREGDHCYTDRQTECESSPPEKFEAPVHEYAHEDGLCSVTGGHVYRGCLNPNLQGLYIYGDYCEGRIFRLKENPRSGKWENKEINMCGDDVCINGLVGKYKRNILSFGEDHTGEIYMLTTDRVRQGYGNGTVYRIVDPRMRSDPSTCGANIFDNKRFHWSCDLEDVASDPWCGMQQQNGSNTMWLRESLGTPTRYTGPHKAGRGEKYAYLDGSPFEKAELILPILPISGTVCFRLWYHMYGKHIGALRIQVNRRSVAYLSGMKQTKHMSEWKLLKVTLYLSDRAKITISGLVGDGPRSHIAIDTISLDGGPCT